MENKEGKNEQEAEKKERMIVRKNERREKDKWL